MKCIICDSEEVKIKYKLEGRDVFECQKCGLEILVNNNPFFYTKKYYEKNYFSEGFNDKEFYKKVSSELNLTEGDNVLDAGCGQGDYLKYLSENYPYIKRCANDLRNILPYRDITEKFFEGDFNDVEFKESFDAITMWDFFEHVNNPVPLLLKARELLTDEGKVFIYTVNSDCLIRRVGDIFYKTGIKNFVEKLYPPYHLYYFKKDNIEKICDKLDMRIVLFGYKYYDTKRMEISALYKAVIKFIYSLESFFSDRKTNIYFIAVKK